MIELHWLPLDVTGISNSPSKQIWHENSMGEMMTMTVMFYFEERNFPLIFALVDHILPRYLKAALSHLHLISSHHSLVLQGQMLAYEDNHPSNLY